MRPPRCIDWWRPPDPAELTIHRTVLGGDEWVAPAVRASSRSCHASSPDDGQMSMAFVAIDLKDDRIARLTIDADLRFCTW